jgi:hypothetical protein
VRATGELVFNTSHSLTLERDSGGYVATLHRDELSVWQGIHDAYLTLLDKFPGEPQQCASVDKLPENFLHLGLIFRTFPNAKVINIIRDPLDNIVSQYRQYFFTGREYSYDLEELVFYWRGYLSLMRHWDSVFPGRILHVDYAQLVRQPQEEIARVLDYCGLSHEAPCFTPHEHVRAVTTPSAQQVRQPITASGLGGGQQYAEFLEPWKEKIALLTELASTSFRFS